MVKIGIVARKSYDEDGVFSFLIREPNLRKSVIDAGGIPFLLLPQGRSDYSVSSNLCKDVEKKRYVELLKLCDGIIIPGGDEWTELDEVALEYALEEDVPLLGICLGMQFLGSFGDVSRVQKIGNDSHKSLENYVHKVSIKKGSFLYHILKREDIHVNSRHFYTVVPTDGWSVSAVSEDGIIEAIEKSNSTFCLGVQWHPEDLLEDENSRKLFTYFINSCSKNKK